MVRPSRDFRCWGLSRPIQDIVETATMTLTGPSRWPHDRRIREHFGLRFSRHATRRKHMLKIDKALTAIH
jgi:hypothetical protein